MIKDIFLDLDDTILDFQRAEREALSATLTQMGVAPTPEGMQRYHEINLQHWKMLERGEITRERLLVRRFEVFFKTVGVEADADRTQRVYEYELGLRSYFLEGAKQMLDDLKGAGYRLYLASNGTTVVQKPRIRAAELAPYFDGIFLSEEIGCDKPSKAFFDACFAAIPAFSPANAIILGDSLSSDIAGGKNAGIRTCWFNPKGTPPAGTICPDFCIPTLSAFFPLVKEL
ncbi:MAG: YjjG family noncanonical pyrimidine nucleotidase [Clostridia bacterium]|nr:YjjG family noncanonical pyrimidine nucleotidase [Clostridia bacterium]